ncbi:hypothetical protein Thein_0244 [Thermodesulfatator indicus DSM 15286]|uniref:Uncharacterized protein n=1 Tax=Thermodesulfatator indicus (strain DSM 15286 / JCM 11887 / CIR29812) TaxID=667014 RepID=F8A9I2_THEID|nr:hypothetical protein [Thermodesulfatator indicus]AEH44129.1 hypothetical protein Thein_0244 [Thermodesulfatator indicus DSM 15286]
MRLLLFLFFLFWASVAQAIVISQQEKELYAAYFFAPERPPTTLGYIFTNFGPGSINYLERVDIVLDRDGKVAGVFLVYTPTDGFRRHVFLKDITGWMFQEVRPNAKGKRVIIRVITSDELNRLN